MMFRSEVTCERYAFTTTQRWGKLSALLRSNGIKKSVAPVQLKQSSQSSVRMSIDTGIVSNCRTVVFYTTFLPNQGQQDQIYGNSATAYVILRQYKTFGRPRIFSRLWLSCKSKKKMLLHQVYIMGVDQLSYYFRNGIFEMLMEL